MKKLKLFAVLVMFAAAGTAAAAWVDNNLTPPAGNTPEPINVSFSPQEKSGSLQLGALSILGSFRIPTGAVAGNVLTSDALGFATWQPGGGGGGGGDNLGNHTATQILDMAGQNIDRVGASINFFDYNGSNDTGLTNSGDGELQIKTNGAPRLTVNNNGDVGIGTTNPSQKLDVVGKVKGQELCIGNDCRNAWPGGGGGAQNLQQVTDIGHTSANKIGLHDSGVGSDEGYHGRLVITRAAANTAQYLNLIRAGQSGWSLGTPYNSSNFAIGGISSNDANFNPALTIRTNGNVGVGTNNPGHKLDVNGNIRMASGNWANSALSPDQGGSIELGGSTGGFGTPYIDFKNGNGQGDGNGDYDVRIKQENDKAISIVTRGFNNAEKKIWLGTHPQFDNLGSMVVADTIVAKNILFENSLGVRSATVDGIFASLFAVAAAIGMAQVSILGVIIGLCIFTGCSDAALKDNIALLPPVMEQLAEIRPVSFDWNQRYGELYKKSTGQEAPKSRQIGLIAQDVEKVFPELVTTGQDGYKSLDYPRFTTVLLKAVQEQQEEIKILRSEMDALKSQVDPPAGR